jgi:ABC-type transport system substrate-binding protein
VYDATYIGTHYDGIPLDAVTADDLVGDDQLGMVTTWTLRPGMYWHDSDPGADGIFGTVDDGELHEVTAADMVWGLNMLRDQEADRYQTQWWFIWAVEQVDKYTLKVCEERRFLFAFEGHDSGLFSPKHIWEPFIEPTFDIASLEITLPDGTTSYGDEIIAWEEHHEDWEGWEWELIPDPGYRDPETGDVAGDAPMLTHLIGFGPFKYHMGGWTVGIGSHFEANRQYFAHGICVGDIYFDKTCELPDWYLTMASVGEYRIDPNYDVKADIAYPAQVIDTSEIYCVQFDHFGHYWGPPPLPGGFTWCDHSTCE